MVNGQEKNLFAEVHHSAQHLQLMELLTFIYQVNLVSVTDLMIPEMVMSD